MAEHFTNDPRVAAVLTGVAAHAPGFAGAVLSLAFIEKLTRRGRILAVCVGLGGAMYIAPAIADVVDLVTPGTLPASVRSATEFLTGLFAMGILPVVLGWLKKVAGDPLSLLKVRIGPAKDEVS